MVAFSDIIDFLLTMLTDDAARAEVDEEPAGEEPVDEAADDADDLTADDALPV